MTKKLFSIAGLGLLAAVFLLTSFLGHFLFKDIRADLTAQRLYTLTAGTSHLLHGLKEPIRLYFFFSEEASRTLPGVRTYGEQVKDMLQTFARESNGRIVLKALDPQAFSEEEDMAGEFGLQPVPLGNNGQTLYFGLAGTNSVDGQETIAFFHPDREEFLEYDLAKLIHILAEPEKPVVGFLSTLPLQGGADPRTQQYSEPWWSFKQLQEQVELETLAQDTKSIDPHIKTLVVVHPKALSQHTRYAIDQFVLRGGRLIVFVDPLAETDPANDHTSELTDLLAAWGVSVSSQQVVGDLGQALSVQSRQTQQVTQHLALIGVNKNYIDQQSPLTHGLGRLNFAYTGFIETKKDATTKVTPLLQSSKNAMLLPSANLTPQDDPATWLPKFKASGQSYTLAAYVTGQVKSAFAKAPEGQDQAQYLATSKSPIQVIVVADVDFLADYLWVNAQNFFGQSIVVPFAQNANFLLNAVDYFAGNADLISIRSRGQFLRPFTRIEALKQHTDVALKQKETQLLKQLEDTERQLGQLQQQRSNQDSFSLNEEQTEALQKFIQSKAKIRKDLRQVRHTLDKQIEHLSGWLKFINIALVPLALLLGWIAVQLRRQKNGLI